ncbi:MAG: DUF4468 domain-containing protein [Prevotella sp.]|nr:DUF4468 domain-containing protein [Prevotella sp.]
MKKTAIFLMFMLPLSVMAQNVWEKPQDTATETVKKKEKAKTDPKYLRGAVPEVDGKVQWELNVDVPGKTAQEIYDIMYKCLNDLTKSEGQLEGSCITLVNKQENTIVASVREWLTFTSNFMSLDRAKFHYTLIANCTDGHMKMTMERISYRYNETKNVPTIYTAEEMITDDKAVNKKNTKLYPGSSRFRRKTIDRKDMLFDTIRNTLKQ